MGHRGQPGRGRDHGHAQQHPHRHFADQPAGQQGDREGGQRQRQEPQPRLDRGVAEGVLYVQRQVDDHPDDRRGDRERHEPGRGEAAPGEQAQVGHGRGGDAQLVDHEPGKGHGGGREQGHDRRARPAQRVAADQREHQRGQRPGDQHRSRPVGPAAGRVAGFAQPGHPARERRHADGQVDEEDGPPAQGVGQHPAGQRADGAGGAERGAEDAQRPGQGGAGEFRAQQRRGGGEQHRAADSLQRAEQLQRQRRRRQRARQRPGGEDDQPGQEQPAPAQPVTQGGRRQQQHRQHQRVGGAHPLQVRQARVQIPLNRRQRHAHYGDVQQQHEHRRAHQRQGPPLPRRPPPDFSHLSHHPKRRPLS